MATPSSPLDAMLSPAHPADAGGQSRDDSLTALRREIMQHQDQTAQESYLDKAISFVTTPFHHEDATLTAAQQVYQRALKDKSVTAADIKAATDADQKADRWHQNVDQIGGEVVKTGALFLRGRVGLAAAVVAYGLSQAKPADDGQGQMYDLALGGLKGGLMQGLFNKIGNVNTNFAVKGVLMGTSSRSIDLGLTRSTWTDPKTGEASLAHGLATMHERAINKNALISDVVVFGAAGSLSLLGKGVAGAALENNKLVATSFTGATFGLSSGAYNEYQRQKDDKESFSLSKIIGAAALHGTINGIAAIPGGLQAGMMVTSAPGERPSPTTARDNVRLAETLGLPGRTSARSNLQFALEPLPAAQASGRALAPEKSAGSPDNAGQYDVTIRSALKDAPPEGRLAVWKQEVASGRDGNLAAASSALSLLPAGDRLAAVQHTIKTAPEQAGFMIQSVEPAKLPELTRSIIDNSSGGQRTNLLNRIYVGDASPEVAENTIKAAAGLTGKDLDVVRTWFRDLPEPPSQWTPGRPATPVLDGLSRSLDPQLVGKLLFEGRENGVDASRLSQEDPQLLGQILRDTDIANPRQMQNVAKVVAAWQSKGSLEAGTQAAIQLASGVNRGLGVEALPDLLTQLAAKSSPADVSGMVSQLRRAATAGGGNASDSQVWLAATTAARIGKVGDNGTRVESGFFKPVVDALSDQNMDYNWRLKTASTLSNLERTGDLPAGTIKVPELRLPTATGFAEGEKADLRNQSEAALRGEKPISTLFGDGALGKLYPHLFGRSDGAAAGGQSETEAALKRVRENQQFASLSPKDQTNLLWATLLDGLGSRQGISASTREANSANIGWGVLRSLGYEPSQIARITNLVSGHSQLAAQPARGAEARLANPDSIDQAAVKYNHPAAPTQVRILNEAGVNGGQLSPEASGQLDQLSQAVAARARELGSGRLPVLTSALPQQAGVFDAPDDYAVLGHTTDHLQGNFFDMLPVLESPQYSLSGTLLTPENSRLWNPQDRLIPLFQGSPESVSQASPVSTGSGENTGWQAHVDLFKQWPSRSEANQTSARVEKSLADLGFGNDKLSALDDFRRQLADYDSIDELTARTGAESPLSRGYRQVIGALTTDGAGHALEEENEIKMNNPTLAGLGIYRRGQNVSLEGAGAGELQAFLGHSAPPSWLDMSGGIGDGNLVIPKPVWSQLLKHNLPIISLDK